MLSRIHPALWALALCALFIALGLVFLPYAGAQYDEVLFVSALYSPEAIEYAMKTRAGAIPVMLMSYVGALKAAIYAPLLGWFEPSHFTLRLPMLLAAALSVVLFFLAARRLAGLRAALLAALLLATDAMYLLTSVFDWGPVAVQHLLFATALYAGIRYRETPRAGWLFLLTFCAGLALWDKAIVVWLLAGFAVSAFVVLRAETLSVLRNRRLAGVAVLGFVLGAAPFLYYNKLHPLRTFTSSADVDGLGALQKIVLLDRTLNGSGLFGFLVREDPEGFPQGLKTWEKAPLWLNGKLQGPRQSLQQVILLGALLALPLVWPTPWRRAWLFFALAAVIAWALMLVTRQAGGSVHHTILLWPLPQMLLSLALAATSARWPGRLTRAATVVVLAAVLHNGLLLNHYLAHFIACGPTWMWTDATPALAARAQQHEGHRFFAADWGISRPLDFYTRGALMQDRFSDSVVLTLADDPNSAPHLEAALADPSTLFITHTDGRDIFPEVRARLLAFAAARGYEHAIIDTIHSRHGAPIFEIHAFRR
jgi:hypothetical protein